MNEDELTKRNEEIARGAAAKLILDSEIFEESFDVVRSGYMRVWAATTADETDTREHAWRMVANLDAVKVQLVSVLATGKMSEEQVAGIPSINASFEEDSDFRIRTFTGG